MSESLAFKYFPWQDWRPSGVNAEFDPSQANTATQNARALLIGQITSSGTATPNIAVQAYSQTQVNGLCGLNSMLALKYAAYRSMDPFGEVWLGPLADASGGTAATGSISFTGPATAAGTLALYLMGVSIPVAVNSGDTASTIATNTVAAISASVGVACSAAVDGTNAYQVDLTALHKGLALNDIDIRFAYRGAQNGEVIPPGVGYTITAFSGGATNPVLDHAAVEPRRPALRLHRPALHRHDQPECVADVPLRCVGPLGGGDDAVRARLLGLSRHLQRPDHLRHRPQRPARDHPRLLRQPDAGVAGGVRLVRRACHPAAGQPGAGPRDAAAQPAAAADRLAGHAGRAQHPAVRRHQHLHGGCGRGVPDRPLDHHLSEQRRAASRTTRI